MADPKTPQKPHEHQVSAEEGAESPTTAQPIDFDDDQQESGIVSPDGTTTVTSTPSKPPRSSSMQHTQPSDEAPPAKPPRPMDPKEQAEATLLEAFPSVDHKVVRAVLAASGNNVEKAFNALLGMSDPDFKEETPPPRPPRPTPQQQQMEQDELYARQLAAQYNSRPHYGQAPSGPPPSGPQPNQRHQSYEEEPSSLDDDFAAIRENVRQGFLTTQTTVNKWISNFKKKMDGEDEDEIGPGPARSQRQDFGPSSGAQMQGINKMAAKPRRSTDQDRYDADPQVLSDDFQELELHDEEVVEDTPPKKPQRPQANPDLFKPTPVPPQSGPVDEVDALYSAPANTNRQPSPSGGGTKSKKWQPLTSVAPAPEQDDQDPFSLGDSDDDEKKHDVRQEDSERLKKAAESASGAEEGERRKSLEPHPRSGSNATKDKTAEDLLKGA